MTDTSPAGRPARPGILVIDNYDSFVYNLVQYVGEVTPDVSVARNDAVTLDDIRDRDPDGIVLSPGPGRPEDAGVSMDVFDLDVPVLGVCLGHQALCAAYGAPVTRAPDVVHGKASTITHDGDGLYARLPDSFEVGRYHSLVVERDALPRELEETATVPDEADVLMGVRHRSRPQFGVQFHPESVLTGRADDPGSLAIGKTLVRTFVADVCSST
ncbi:anthranilate synthase component II [Halocalculus aciditolerans]|uniref:anthranilate synthase n=1 Tax=Halocalculus aciditolerans TaxID=1383812 RepID=A0A830FD45_9EURY|nr:aminodeoxychorismate/anthranilate synthase component II [Halocalculus aciditolerans]GGL63256.1 glutamine amidotransferase [Halocalculus aciditolerans]